MAYSWKLWLILGLVCLLSAAGYLLVSRSIDRVGFPLDDAWIHQTYARNLALRGEWSFIPGKPSGGSTSPLWSTLLAVGYWLQLGPLAWAYLLGTAALFGLSVLAEKTARTIVPAYSPRFPWVGTLLALEWHLVWASVSGMETLLYAMLAAFILFLLMTGSKKYFAMGLLAGLSVWVRPDGITLLGPIFFVILLNLPDWRARLRAVAQTGLGFASLFALYLLFNLRVSGSPWPNTFYAKQAEYAALLAKPFVQRLGGEFLQPLIGVGILLFAGALIAVTRAVRQRSWGILAAALWLVGFLGLYAWKLPVTYQHGRYVIPAMPIFFILGAIGLSQFSLQARQGWKLFVSFSWPVAAAAVLALFWGRGALAYGQDVAVIDSEMVTTAKWVAANVPPDARVAAHDIGAMGYYGNHDLVDLAGLVSPQVIPFLRDQTRLAGYITSQNVEYLITFPDWYPRLVGGLECVYSTGGRFAPSLGGTNMAVYRWTGR